MPAPPPGFAPMPGHALLAVLRDQLGYAGREDQAGRVTLTSPGRPTLVLALPDDGQIGAALVRDVLVRQVGLTRLEAQELCRVDVTHLILTDEGDFGFSMTSPQLPGLVLARVTEHDVRDAARAALAAAGVRGVLDQHLQRRGTTPGGREYVVRYATDGPDAAQRLVTARRLQSVLDSAEGDEVVAAQVTDPAGVVTFVCCVATDTLRWVEQQLDHRGDSLVATVAVANQLVHCLGLSTGATTGQETPPLLDELGLDLATPVSELMHTGSRSRQRLARIAAPTSAAAGHATTSGLLG